MNFEDGSEAQCNRETTKQADVEEMSRLTQLIYATSRFLRTLMRVYLRVLFPSKQKRDRWLSLIWISPSVLPSFVPNRLQYYYVTRTWTEITLVTNSWEPEVTRFLTTLKGGIFIDIGANVGYYSILLKDNFKRIIAIEPDPVMYTLLLARKPPTCFAIRAAVADGTGLVKFYSATSSSSFKTGGWNLGSGSLSTHKETEHREGERSKSEIVVQQKRLADVVPTEIVDLVKVDVEGAEWLVLRGAEPIMQNIRSWLIEVHDPSKEAELVSYMNKYGYESKWIDKNHAYFTRDSGSSDALVSS